MLAVTYSKEVIKPQHYLPNLESLPPLLGSLWNNSILEFTTVFHRLASSHTESIVPHSFTSKN